GGVFVAPINTYIPRESERRLSVVFLAPSRRGCHTKPAIAQSSTLRARFHFIKSTGLLLLFLTAAFTQVATGGPVVCLVGDFNGDGKSDIACHSGSGGNWHVGLSTGSGWNNPVWTGGPGPRRPVGNQCFTGDFNGDGKSDIACYSGSGGNWYVGLSSGSGWNSPVWTGGPGPRLPVGNQCVVGDFSGDGKSDIACYSGSGG